MKSLFGRFRYNRLASTFTILATLSAGILVGSFVAHQVRGQESQVNSSDAAPLKVPAPRELSTDFSRIAKEVGPAVVNINTEILPKQQQQNRRRGPHYMQPWSAPQQPQQQQPPDGDDDDQGPQGGQGGQGQGGQGGQGGLQDFFNRFFGGQNPGMDGGDDGEARESLGSGFIVDPRGYIITNNHVVDKADRIFVKLASDPEGNQGRPAKVVGVDKATDIAVLKIQTDTPLPTVKMGNSDGVQVGDWAIAIGEPFGLAKTVTAGIISSKNRTVEPGTSGEFQHFLQTDAAINPGNSGGPAVAGDKMIGLAFSRLAGNAENIGYIIPSEEIELFLRDIGDRTAKGKPIMDDGKPGMHDELQTLENPGLRAFLKVDKSVEGLVVNRPDSSDPAYPLKPWDVITKIGDTPINDQGMIKLRDNLQVNFGYLVQKIAVAGKVRLSVVRAGQPLALDLPVASTRPMLIPDLRGAYPSYFVCGPLVFSVATAQFLEGFNANANAGGVLRFLSSIGSPLMARRGDRPAFPGEQLVVISSPFFPHRLAENYSSQVLHVVKSVNGIRIKNLRHLVEVLRDCRDPFVVVEFYERDSESLVFPREPLFASTDDILTDNGVRAQGSPDMLAVWNARPPAP